MIDLDTTDDATPREIRKPQEGEVLHWLRSGVVHHRVFGTRLSGEISRRGEQMTITRGDLENVDRNGACWLDLLHDPDRQVARWGHVAFAPGAAPEGMSPWSPDNAADVDQERARRMDALVGVAGQAKLDAVRKIDRDLGKQVTSTTLNTVRDAS